MEVEAWVSVKMLLLFTRYVLLSTCIGGSTDWLSSSIVYRPSAANLISMTGKSTTNPICGYKHIM